ncbi:MAG: hypothetical protein GW763_02770 [Paraglaciecola sp.]|nr:hypothetical protein [Paraglaciecola sp.]NCT46909.1 hypothetical protein [Paraglaciecola sp.]
MTIKFSEHGSFEVQVDGNILVARLVGGWNIEAANTSLVTALKPQLRPSFMLIGAILSF